MMLLLKFHSIRFNNALMKENDIALDPSSVFSPQCRSLHSQLTAEHPPHLSPCRLRSSHAICHASKCLDLPLSALLSKVASLRCPLAAFSNSVLYAYFPTVQVGRYSKSISFSAELVNLTSSNRMQSPEVRIPT